MQEEGPPACIACSSSLFSLCGLSKREDQTGRREIFLCCRAQSKASQICLGKLKAAAVDAYAIRHVDRLFACQVLSYDSPALKWPVEDEGKHCKTAKDTIWSGSISDVQLYLCRGHIPVTAGSSAFLGADSDSAVRKSRCKDERLLAARGDAWQSNVPRHACRRSLVRGLSCEVVRPGLPAFEGPAIRKNLIADLDGAGTGGIGSCDALPTHRAHHLVHAALGLSRSVEEQVRVRRWPQSVQRMTKHAHGAAHRGSDVDLVLNVQQCAAVASLRTLQHLGKAVEGCGQGEDRGHIVGAIDVGAGKD